MFHVLTSPLKSERLNVANRLVIPETSQLVKSAEVIPAESKVRAKEVIPLRSGASVALTSRLEQPKVFAEYFAFGVASNRFELAVDVVDGVVLVGWP